MDERNDRGGLNMEKVVVPQFVADYIENHYGGSLATNWDRADLIRDWDNYIKTSGNSKVKEWVKNESNFLFFIMAIATNNYEVEEEKKYYWRKKKEYLFEFEDDYIYLNIHIGTGEPRFNNYFNNSMFQTLLTETEAKQVVTEEDFKKLERVEADDV